MIDKPIVMIEWYDAAGGSKTGWHSMHEATKDPAHAISIGFIINDAPDYYMICPHVMVDNNDIDGEIVIPKGWIKKIWFLRKHKYVESNNDS